MKKLNEFKTALASLQTVKNCKLFRKSSAANKNELFSTNKERCTYCSTKHSTQSKFPLSVPIVPLAKG